MHQYTGCCKSSSKHLELYEQDGKDPTVNTEFISIPVKLTPKFKCNITCNQDQIVNINIRVKEQQRTIKKQDANLHSKCFSAIKKESNVQPTSYSMENILLDGTLLGWTYEYTFNTHMRSLCYSTAEPSLRRVV